MLNTPLIVTWVCKQNRNSDIYSQNNSYKDLIFYDR